jgi:hypothetical protein
VGDVSAVILRAGAFHVIPSVSEESCIAAVNLSSQGSASSAAHGGLPFAKEDSSLTLGMT